MRFLNIGYNSIVNASRIIAIVAPDSAPVKRLIRDAQDHGQLIDATFGRKTRAVFIMDSGHVVLCAILPETVANRLEEGA